jgi:hypothetical protein
MAVVVGSNQITGITATSGSTDAASKNYVDTTNPFPTTTGQENEFLRTDGSSVSWEPIGAYQEYTSPGTYTFTVPAQAKELFIETTGAGGGGASGNTDDSSYVNSGQNFSIRVSGAVSQNSLTYGSNLYVSVGDSGSARTSIDGITWVSRTVSTTQNINAVAYNSSKSTYIAGGYGAPEWTRNDLGSSPFAGFNAVVYSAGQPSNFVAAGGLGGTSANLASSSSGTSSWTIRTSGFGTTAIQALTYYLFNGTTPTYVIGGAVAKNTWVLRTAGFGSTNVAAVFGNNTYVIVGNSGGVSGRIITSTNSIIWTLRSSGNDLGGAGSLLRHLSFASDKPSAAYLTGNTNVALTSTNAIYWTRQLTGFGSTAQAASTYFNGEYLIGGASTTTVTWIASGPATTGDFLGTTYGNGLFVVGGISGRIFTSPDGITWTARTNAGNGQMGFSNSDRSIVYASDQGIYVGAFGSQVVTSTNAIIWTLRSTGQTTAITTIAYGLVNGTTPTYVAGINLPNALRTSTNAIFWTIRTGASSQYPIVCLYANNKFVLGGDTGNISTSTNGIFWESKFNSINNTANITGIAYDSVNQLYAACDSASPSAFYTSTDANAWILRTQPVSNTMYSMDAGNGLFVAGVSASSITSTNGIIWILRTGVNTSQYTITYGNNIWITAGATGAIQYSTTDRLNNLGWGALLKASTDGSAWTTRTTAVSSQAITTMGSGGSYAFIYGTNLIGAPFLNVSTNNIIWTSKNSPLGASSINTFAYDGTNYIAAGDSGTLAVSTDTTNWTFRTSGFGANSIQALTYGNGVYIASGASGITRTSTDNIIWIARTSEVVATTIISTLYNSANDIYVNVSADTFVNTSTKNILGSLGSGALLSTSTDAISWTIRTTGLNTETVTALGTGAGNSLFVAGISNYLNQSTIFVSSDGIIWTARTAGFGTSTINSILYAGGNYFAASNGNALLLSTDALVWQSQNTGLAAATALNSLTYGTSPTNTYVVGGTSGSLATSTDGGTTWILRTSGTASSINALAYNNGVYVFGGNSGVSFTSTNAIYWFARTSGFGATVINGLAYGNNLYVFVGGGAGINATSYSTQTILSNYGQGAYASSSSDGITWVLRTAGLNTQNITALTTSSNFYVAGYLDSILNSNIVVSTDALVWQFRTSGFGRSAINSLYYDGTNYIAAGDGGTLAVSTDTTNWTLRTSGFGVSGINSLTYGNGIYIAAGDLGTLITSPDTITWTLRTSGTTANINALTYNNGVYVLAGQTGLFRYSTNSINWSSRVIGFGSSNIRAITWGTPSGSGIFPGFVAVAGTSGGATSGAISSSINPGGFAGSGGGGGATVSWNISKAYISGSSLTVNVGQGGAAGQAGAASTVSWTGNSGTYALTANGGSGGSNVYDTTSSKPPGGAGGTIPSSLSNYLTATAGASGGAGSVRFGGVAYNATVGISGILAFQTSGGGGAAYTGDTAQAAGSINYYGNNNPISANTSATAISGLSYGNGGGGGSAGSAGGSGVRGGGGGGGGYNSTTDTAGAGGVGGDGYVRISWQ